MSSLPLGLHDQRRSLLVLAGRGMYACVLACHPGYLLLNPPVGILQAGIVIAQEAGGFVTGSKDTPHDGVITEAILTGRRYLVIRGVAGTPVRTISLLF